MDHQGGLCIVQHPKNVAIVFGVTGLVGREVARKLLASGSKWEVYGVARNSDDNDHLLLIQGSNYHFISCDLLNPLQVEEKLTQLKHLVTHMFWITWASQFPLDGEECCNLNNAMMSNALDALISPNTPLKHVSIQTGMKHYISLRGPFDGTTCCYYNEESPRVATSPNFYYALEDLVKDRLNGNVAWSVHRPGLIMGCSRRSWFNFIGSICVYGTLCKHLSLPFVFGGTRECWEEVCIDGSDARLVADQHIWAATNEDISASKNGHAFNCINGTSFTWKQIWPAFRVKLGVALAAEEEMFSEDYNFSQGMDGMSEVWREISIKEGLAETELSNLANWGFLDMLFRCPFKLLGSREKVNKMGFKVEYQALDSIHYWVDFMRSQKLIP
ncbi:unnamed protein product [Rhodiola kirilowii]